MTGDVDYGFCYPEAFQQTQASLDRTLAGMAELRAKRVRILIPWSQTQIGPGNYNFAVTDAAVYSAVAHGLKPLLVYATFPTPPSAGSAADFGAWVGAFAKHYADVGVTDHELWNEQNAFGFWPGPPSAASYAPFLRAGYTAIKAVQPNSTVISGGMNPCGNGWLLFTLSVDPIDFLAGIYAAGGKGTFDAVGNHPYSIATSATGSVAEKPSATETYIVKDQKVYDVMVANGDGAKQIWHTEYGFPRSVVGAQNQKDWLKIQFDILHSRPYVGPTFFYAHHDLTADTGASESTFGCVDFNYVKQLSWDFYDSLASPNPAFAARGTLIATATITGKGTVNGQYVATATATATAHLDASQPGSLDATATITGEGMVVTQTAFSYDFGAAPSTKPTTLFTDFGLGYGVSGGVANGTAPITSGENKSGGIYLTPTASPDHFSKVIIGPGGLSPDRSDLPIVRTDAAGNNYVCAVGTAWQSQIVTVIGGVSTVRSSANVGFANGDELGIIADGDTYTVTKNGVPVPNLAWLDNTHVFPGYLNRHLGFGFQQQYTDRAYPAPGITKWTAGDIRPIAPRTPPPMGMATITGTAVLAGRGGVIATAAITGTATTSGATAVGGSLAATAAIAGVGRVGVRASGVPLAAVSTAAGSGSGNGVFADSPAMQATATATGNGAVGVGVSGSLVAVATMAESHVMAGSHTFSGTARGPFNTTFWGNNGQDVSVANGQMIEGASTNSFSTAPNGVLFAGAAYLMPMGTMLHIASIQVGVNTPLGVNPPRAQGAAVAGSDNVMTNCVIGVISGTGSVGTGVIYSKVGGTYVSQQSGSVTVTTGDVVSILVQFDGAHFVYSLLKNYTYTGISWTDNANLITPGPWTSPVFAGAQSGGIYYGSAGIVAYSAQDLPSAVNASGGLAAAATIGGAARVGGTAQGMLTATAAITGRAGVGARGTLSATATIVGQGSQPTGGGSLTATATAAGSATAGKNATGDLSAAATITGTASVTSVGAPPAYDATGAGGTSTAGFGSSISVGFNHVGVGANETVLVAFVSRNGGIANASQASTVTYGGAAMTLVGTVAIASDVFLSVYKITGQAAGTKAVSITVSGGGNTGRSIAACSVSYTGVATIQTPTTATGNGNSPSVTVASSSSERVFNVMGATTVGAWTGYTQTQRDSKVSSDTYALAIVGDALGATSLTFGSTMNSSNPWAAIAVRVSP